MKQLFITFLFSAFLLAADYSARELQNEVQIKTPYGEKTVIGDYGMSNYRFEIPIDEFLPEKLKEMKMRGENIDQLKESLAKELRESSNTNTNTIETKIIERTLGSDDESQTKDKKHSNVTVEYDDSDRLVIEANRLYNKRKYEESLAVIDELLRRKPSFVRGWVMKGSVLFVKGHRDLARTAWKKAQVIEPQNEDIKSILEKYK